MLPFHVGTARPKRAAAAKAVEIIIQYYYYCTVLLLENLRVRDVNIIYILASIYAHILQIATLE